MCSAHSTSSYIVGHMCNKMSSTTITIMVVDGEQQVDFSFTQNVDCFQNSSRYKLVCYFLYQIVGFQQQLNIKYLIVVQLQTICINRSI